MIFYDGMIHPDGVDTGTLSICIVERLMTGSYDTLNTLYGDGFGPLTESLPLRAVNVLSVTA